MNKRQRHEELSNYYYYLELSKNCSKSKTTEGAQKMLH